MIAQLCKEFGVSPSAVLGKSRAGRLPDARHWWMWWLSRVGGLSNMAIARALLVDESSVRHALRKCDRLVRRGVAPAAFRGAL